MLPNSDLAIRLGSSSLDRMTAVICMPDHQDNESYIADAIGALGIKVVFVKSSEFLSVIEEHGAQIIVMHLSNPIYHKDQISLAQLAVKNLDTINHVKFYCNEDMSVMDRVSIAKMKDAFLYNEDASPAKIANDIKYHVAGVDTHALKVLLIDDSMTEAFLTKKALTDAGCDVVALYSPLEAYEQLQKETPDIIVVDLHMPEMNGDSFVRLVRQEPRFLSLPVVFLSNEDDDQLRIKAVANGADDFISKPVSPTHFPLYIANRVVRAREQGDKMNRDSLTGLLNHSSVMEHINASNNSGAFESISIIMLDIDHFKQVNDLYGHQTGDKVLRSISALLSRSLRQGDLVGRFGGEEFIVALPDTPLNNTLVIMNRILKTFKEFTFIDEYDKSFHCSFSAGVSILKPGESLDHAIGHADRMLYEAKSKGRSQVKIMNIA